MPAYWSVRATPHHVNARARISIFHRTDLSFALMHGARVCAQGKSVPSGIVRTNRPGADVGTSPGINPITPYTTAALDYRASWIAGEMMEKTKVCSCDIPKRIAGHRG